MEKMFIKNYLTKKLCAYNKTNIYESFSIAYYFWKAFGLISYKMKKSDNFPSYKKSRLGVCYSLTFLALFVGN